MEWTTLTSDNLEKEHVCCAISNNKDPQVQAKKSWLSARLHEGLVFLKGDVRGKCFIEYIPAEYAWAPVDAPDYMFINCFWISGQFKGQGYSRALLDACIQDSKAKDKAGLCLISSPKKLPFLSDPSFCHHMGFAEADTAKPYFTLLYLPFREDAPKPCFREQVRQPQIDENGFVLYYSGGCPYPAKYAPLIEAAAHDAGYPFQSIHIDSLEAAKHAPAAWTNYALFYNGQFVTHEILSEKKFLTLAEKLTSAE